MKTLSNISPFILLLVPVFVMTLLAFTTSINNHQNEEAALKTNTTSTIQNPLVKANALFSK
jgi:hypothetical protein